MRLPLVSSEPRACRLGTTRENDPEGLYITDDSFEDNRADSCVLNYDHTTTSRLLNGPFGRSAWSW